MRSNKCDCFSATAGCLYSFTKCCWQTVVLQPVRFVITRFARYCPPFSRFFTRSHASSQSRFSAQFVQVIATRSARSWQFEAINATVSLQPLVVCILLLNAAGKLSCFNP